jgi:hypothetical protein
VPDSRHTREIDDEFALGSEAEIVSIREMGSAICQEAEQIQSSNLEARTSANGQEQNSAIPIRDSFLLLQEGLQKSGYPAY